MINVDKKVRAQFKSIFIRYQKLWADKNKWDNKADEWTYKVNRLAQDMQDLGNEHNFDTQKLCGELEKEDKP